MTKEEQSCLENGEANSTKGGKADDLEAMLAHLGDFGRYQRFLVLGMCPFGMMFSFVYFIQMFITLTPQTHWCRVPELSHLEPGLRRNLTAPRVGEEWDKCSMYVANWSHILETLKPPDPSTPTAPCLHGWDFELTDIPYHTVVTERGWVCEYAGYAPTAQAVFFAGSFVGVIFFGWLADAHGRVPALVGSTLLAFVGGIATIFTTGFWDFTICRFIAGLSFDSIFMCTYILLIEYIGPRYRTVVANTSMAIIFGAGCLSLPWLALQICDWRKLVWITTAPLAIIAIAPYTVPESARWLLTKGHIERLVKVLRKFEKINRKTIPQDELEDFIVASNRTKLTEESIKSLMKSVPLRKMMIFLVALYMIQALVFDGLVRMSEGLGVNFFLTFTLTSATEIPSVIVLVLILDRWGRRHVTCGPIITGGVVVLIAMFVAKGAPLVSLVVLARFLINISYGAFLQWSTELLPTSVRASGSSLIHVSGFVAALFSPFVVYSGRVWAELPLLILALLSLVAGGLATLLPETMGKPLPQTFEDGERVVREYTLCGKSEDHGDLELQYRKRTSLTN